MLNRAEKIVQLRISQIIMCVRARSVTTGIYKYLGRFKNVVVGLFLALDVTPALLSCHSLTVVKP